MTAALGLYRAGTSPLHRLPAGAKLTGLAVTGAGSVLVDTPAQTVVFVAAALALYPVGRLPVRVLVDMVRPLAWVLVPLAGFQIVFIGWARTVVLVGVILALVLVANVVTLTTRTTDLIDVVVARCRPLRVVGIDPLRVGLVLNLAIRCVPLMADLAADVRDAQRARGLELSARAFVVPLLVRALHRAEELGDALAARGFGD